MHLTCLWSQLLSDVRLLNVSEQTTLLRFKRNELKSVDISSTQSITNFEVLFALKVEVLSEFYSLKGVLEGGRRRCKLCETIECT